MATNNKIPYSPEQQAEFLRQALDILDRYMTSKCITELHIGGSAIDGTFGVYEKPKRRESGDVGGSDVDTIMVVRSGNDLERNPEMQRRFGFRYDRTHGKKHKQVEGLSIYRICNRDGYPVFLGGIHPLEAMVIPYDQLGTVTARCPDIFSAFVKLK